MKKIVFAAVTLVLAVMLGGCSSKMSRSEKAKQKEQEVIAAVESMNYRIAISRAHAFAGSTLTSEYAVEIRDNMADVYLPFIGQAYNITFEDKGIDFTEEILDYEWSVTKRRSIFISFRVRTGEEFYKFAIEIYLNGNCYVTLTPLNKQAINFVGELVPVKGA